MAMLESTKRLKEYGAAAGLLKSEVSILREKKFVGKHVTNKGTTINLYETHDVTAHVSSTRLREMPREEAFAIIEKLADLGPCEVCFFESTSDPEKIGHIMYRDCYSKDGKGRIRNVSAESRYLEKAIKEADEQIAKYEAEHGKDEE